MWQPDFARIIELWEKGVVIHDETTAVFIFIADLSDVMQFETDNRVGEFEPHFHYDVKPVIAP